MTIRVLAPEVQGQIAAGEVIERPASVVKELVENSLDAGATKIVVEIEAGGTTLVRVSDDGLGCGEKDLPLAFVAHATSKLAELADLEKIASLGFRGEALAAIGSVARARMQSRIRGAREGHAVECTGGVISPVRPCGCPEGTTVEVRDLFFNTPARRRFLKATYAERARIHELLARLVTPRVDVDLTLLSEGKPLLRLPAGETFAQRVARAFGASFAPGMKHVAVESGGYRVEGVVVEPDRASSDSTLELLWVNGRLAKDRGALMAIRQAFREHLMHGRYPVYFLQLALPPEEVDVNVHPQKAEVRFANARKVAGLLHGAVLRTLRGDLHAREAAAGADGPAAAYPAASDDGGGISVREGLPRARSGFAGLPPAPPREAPPREIFQPLLPAHGAPAPAAAPASGARENPFRLLDPRSVLQVFDLYLVLQGEQGLVVVDQHALHERVLYERLKKEHERAAHGASIKVQRLLSPEVVDVQPVDKAWLLEVKTALAEEGFLLDDFGGNAVAIHGMPAVLGRSSPGRVLLAFLRAEGSDEPRPRARAAVAERFHSMACRGAVMSGDRLGQAEIERLLADAKDLEHPHNCPHGRPTVLTFTRAELERFFRRRV